jgi:hypothetical protein
MPVMLTPRPASRASAGLQGRETLCSREGSVFHLAGVAQDGCCCGAADVDGHACPFALAIDLHEARRRSAEAAHDLSSRLHAIEDRSRIDAMPGQGHGEPDCHGQHGLAHEDAPRHALAVIPSVARDLSGSSKGPSLRSG